MKFAIFETAIGCCGIVWANGAVVGTQLPEADEDGTRKRLLERFPDARPSTPPDEIQRVIDDIEALLRGQRRDLSEVLLDTRGVPPFHRRVYEIARTIVPGATVSYGEIAARLGSPGSARAVGQAMGKNPFPIIVPCHRVLGANGKLGGFSANGGVSTKREMLTLEGVRVADLEKRVARRAGR